MSVKSDNIDFLFALTPISDGTYSNSPTNHYESEEPGGLLTLVFDTYDDKSKVIITVTGDGVPECPNYVIFPIFGLFRFLLLFAFLFLFLLFLCL